MILWGADAREIKRVAADSPGAVSQAFEAAGGHLLSDGKAFGRIGFAEGAEGGEFLSLSLGAVWRWKTGGEADNGESQESRKLHFRTLGLVMVIAKMCSI